MIVQALRNVWNTQVNLFCPSSHVYIDLVCAWHLSVRDNEKGGCYDTEVEIAFVVSNCKRVLPDVVHTIYVIILLVRSDFPSHVVCT